MLEQLWPSSDELNVHQNGPWFEAHHRPIVTSEGHPILNARARTTVLSEAASMPQGIGGNGGKIEFQTLCYQNQMYNGCTGKD